MTRIVTDGGADLPVAVAASASITVVRGAVHLGGTTWDGGLDQFWAALGKGSDFPVTEAPSTDALAAAYGDREPVLAVHVSAELSETLAHAKAAAGRSAASVEVVDSRSLSVGTGLLALAAAEAAQAGVEGARLRELTLSWVDQLHVHAVIEDAALLVHGGRAGLVAAKVGKHAHRHVIAVQGHAIPIREVRHRAEAIRELIDHVRDHMGTRTARWAVGHGAASDVDEFVERLAGVFGHDPTYVTLLGAPVGSHTGPGSLVVSFFSDG